VRRILLAGRGGQPHKPLGPHNARNGVKHDKIRLFRALWGGGNPHLKGGVSCVIVNPAVPRVSIVETLREGFGCEGAEVSVDVDANMVSVWIPVPPVLVCVKFNNHAWRKTLISQSDSVMFIWDEGAELQFREGEREGKKESKIDWRNKQIKEQKKKEGKIRERWNDGSKIRNQPQGPTHLRPVHLRLQKIGGRRFGQS